MDKQQALHQFWSQFGTAYEETSVPDDADIETGYITYQKYVSAIDEPVFPTASVWTRSSSWAKADNIVNQINRALENGGQIFPIEGGRMWVVRGSPFAQAMSDTDRTIRRYLINVSVEFFTE